jgi:uncharacterized protein (TIGR02598 family)
MISRNHGFTLVETMLAVAISAVLLLTLVALLPMGLDSAREGRRQSVVTGILDHLRHQNLPQSTSGEFRFDSDGLPRPQHDPRITFTARVNPVDPVPLPGNAGASLRRLHITLLDERGKPLLTTHLVLAPPPP